MIFAATSVVGLWRIQPEPIADERGHFARLYDEEIFRQRHLETRFVQASTSVSPRRGTLRGLHFQASPWEEVKLVRCTRGRVWDVAVDLRPESPSYLAHHAQELGAAQGEALYLPKGVAHGFLTLEDDSEILYQMSTPYRPGAGRGVRWNDPAFGVEWPAAPELISPRDAEYPDYERLETR